MFIEMALINNDFIISIQTFKKCFCYTKSQGFEFSLCRMTGVGGRPEVIIEGSNSVESGWKEYEFYYKPGNISRVPSIVGKSSREKY